MKLLRLTQMLCLLLVSCCLPSGTSWAATFKGKVVSQDGNAVAGATVWASALGLTTYSEADGSIKKVMTTVDGSFQFDIDLPAKTSGFVFLRVQADNFATEDTIMKAGEKTIKLSPPNKVRGIVKNAKGEPVADAPVQVIFSPGNIQALENDLQQDGMNVFISLMAWASALPPIKAQSGPDGKWELNAAKTAIIGLKDPRFASAFGMSGMGGVRGLEDSGFMTLLAQPGASVKGTLLTAEGKPLKDAFVIAASGVFGSPSKVGADGSFLIEGLPPSNVVLMGLTTDTEWIVSPLQITKPLETGKVNDAPAWKAVKGIEVTGVVINKKTGKPIPNVSVNSVVSGGTKSDEQGKFKMRAAPQMGVLQVMHPDYAPYMKPLDKMGNGPTYDAGQIALDPILKTKGRLVDIEGKPIANIALMATAKQDPNAASFVPSMTNTTTDTEGGFELKLAPGPAILTIQDKAWALDADPYYSFEQSETMPPLTLKAKKLLPQQASGRVLRPNGQPVAKATVVAEVVKPDPPQGAVYFSSRDQVNAETDGEGRFTAQVFGDVKELKILKVEGDQYVMRQNGTGKKEGNNWQLSDTVVALLNSSVKGHVVDAKGAPIVGAWVASPEATSFVPVKTDAGGNFTLDKLPEGAALIYAAYNTSFARGNAKDGAVELAVTEPARFVLPMRRQFFQQAAKAGLSDLYPYWKNIGSERMLSFALQADGALPYGETSTAGAAWNQAGTAVLKLLRQSLDSDPQWLRLNGLELLAKVPDDKNEDDRFNAEAATAAALAYGDEKQRITAKQWLDFESKMPDTRDNPVKNAARWFFLAGIAGALDDPRANNFALNALTFADAAGKKTIENNATYWGRSLGLGGAKLMSLLDGEWDIKPRVSAYSGAIGAVAPLDTKRAQAYLETLKELEKDPEAKKDRDAQEAAGRGRQQLPSENATYAIAKALNTTDPAAALASITDAKDFNWTGRENIARSAWRAGKYDIVAQTIRPALEQPWWSAATMSRFAVMAEAFDKDLAAKFWDKADERLKQSELQDASPNAYRDYQELADYAYYRARQDPALSRLRLELTWPSAHPKGDKDETRYNRWSHYNLISAMMALDPVRALEMMADSDDQGRQNARARIIAFLLADDKERSILQAEY